MEDYSSIYFEAFWVLLLFVATATLREAIGELCVHKISHSILSCTHVNGQTIDVFVSCSNGGRSLGFGAAWRMWNLDKSGVISNTIVALPFCCWAIGMPIKLIAVQAVRGGNIILGKWGTWTLGISWITLCVIVKIVAIIIDRKHGIIDKNGKKLSYRRIFQVRFCRIESYGMMIQPKEYSTSKSFLQPSPNASPLGIDIHWTKDGSDLQLSMKLVRRGKSDATPNDLNYLLMDSQDHEMERVSVEDELLNQ